MSIIAVANLVAGRKLGDRVLGERASLVKVSADADGSIQIQGPPELEALVIEDCHRMEEWGRQPIQAD